MYWPAPGNFERSVTSRSLPLVICISYTIIFLHFSPTQNRIILFLTSIKVDVDKQ